MGWEISEDVGPVTSPEGNNTFFSDTSLETVNDAWIRFVIPVYGLSLNLGLFYWVWRRSLTLSMGAARVLAIAPDVPPSTKSIKILEVPLFWEPEDGADWTVIYKIDFKIDLIKS